MRQKKISELLEMWRSLHNHRSSRGKCRCHACRVLASHREQHERDRCEQCARIVEDYAIAEYKRSQRPKSPLTRPEDTDSLLHEKTRRVLRYDYGIRFTLQAHDRIVMFHPEGQAV